MTPEREKQVERIYERALGLAPARRGAYLDEACAGDEELRRAVESRLDAANAGAATNADAAGAEDERPTPRRGSAPPEIVPGVTKFGAYRVLEKIGAGGMGTVYLAKDARLGRRVALKLLPAHFARDEELVRRFEQEARAASALNHPNILTVHEIGEEGGRLYIVTEFVEGRTLRERLWEGTFSVGEALDVCAQVAGALQ